MYFPTHVDYSNTATDGDAKREARMTFRKAAGTFNTIVTGVMPTSWRVETYSMSVIRSYSFDLC
jgi:hypothetical protein